MIREHDRGESYVNTKDIFYQGTYVFNPSGTVLQYWHSLMRFSSVFVFFNVPFIIAFQPLQGHDVLGLEEVFSQVLQVSLVIRNSHSMSNSSRTRLLPGVLLS